MRQARKCPDEGCLKGERFAGRWRERFGRIFVWIWREASNFELSWTPESAEISVRLGFLNCWYDWNASSKNWTFLSKIEWTTSFSSQIHPRDQKKQYKGSKLLGVFPQTFCRIVSEQSSAHQKLHISLNSTGTVKSLSESFDPIGTKVASNWIVIDQIGAVLAKGTVQTSWFAYFCGYLRTFAGYLRTFCGVVLPHFFFDLGRFWTPRSTKHHQTAMFWGVKVELT